MGMLDPNTVIGIINGKIGDLVFVRTSDGRVVVRHRPVRALPFTGPELANQSRFAHAVAYVRRIAQDAATNGVYQTVAKLKHKRACDLANADFRHPPVIMDLDLSAYTGAPGQVLPVTAIDDFEVISVSITITDIAGTLLEHGAALLDQASGSWRYLTQVPAPSGQAVIIHVSASDRAGNAITKTFYSAPLSSS